MNSTAVDRPGQPAPPRERGGALWYALVAPPAAWTAQGLLGWFFGERVCGSLTPAAVRWIVLGISVAALAIALAGIARASRLWRRRSRELPHEADASDRVEFMALGGVFVSTVFSLAIVWAGLSTAFLNDCGRMR